MIVRTGALAACVILVAACGAPGPEDAALEPLQAPSSSINEAGDRATDVEFDPLTLPCDEPHPSTRVRGDAVLRVEKIRLGDRRFADAEESTLVRELILEDVSVLAGPTDLVDADGNVTMWAKLATLRSDGGWSAAGTLRLEDSDLGDLTKAIVRGYADDAAETPLYFAGMLAANAHGAVVTLDGCDPAYEALLLQMSEQSGFTDSIDFAAHWASAIADGGGQEFDRLETSILGADATLPTDGWSRADPATRGLDPSTIPPELKDLLDVGLGIVDLADIGAHEAIWFATSSGTSGGVGHAALGSRVPFYYVPSIDRTITVMAGTMASQANASLIASIPTHALESGGGMELTGSVSDGTVTARVLTRAEAAAVLNVDDAGLDALRLEYLGRDR